MARWTVLRQHAEVSHRARAVLQQRRRRAYRHHVCHPVMVLCVAVTLVTSSSKLSAAPAHFWISTSNVSPSGPTAPSIPSVNGSVRFLHIWGRPGTDVSGFFKQMLNLSLTLETNAPFIDFLDGGIVVHNPVNQATPRYQFFSDSSTGLSSDLTAEDILTFGVPDRIRRLRGFLILSGGSYSGIGAQCSNDPYCAMTSSGPAWWIATVASQTIVDTGIADYFLQVGFDGMNHVGEDSSLTQVIFGSGSGPVYNAAIHREETIFGDSPDFTIQAAPQSSVTQISWPGGNGQWSQLSNGSPPSWLNDVVLNAGLVTVDGAQQGNVTTVNGGRLHINASGSLASDVVVNSGAAVSGEGWVNANLTLDGELTIGAAQPLRVIGAANVDGGSFGLTADYTQPPNTTAELVILESLGGIQGRLDVPIDPQLRPGLFFESISYSSSRITLRLRSDATGVPGDYNGDGQVNTADYVILRKGGPLQNEHVSIGVVNAADFSFWKARFGTTVGASAGSGKANVPEPATGPVLLIAIWILGCRRPKARQAAIARYRQE